MSHGSFENVGSGRSGRSSRDYSSPIGKKCFQEDRLTGFVTGAGGGRATVKGEIVRTCECKSSGGDAQGWRIGSRTFRSAPGTWGAGFDATLGGGKTKGIQKETGMAPCECPAKGVQEGGTFDTTCRFALGLVKPWDNRRRIVLDLTEHITWEEIPYDPDAEDVDNDNNRNINEKKFKEAVTSAISRSSAQASYQPSCECYALV